MTMLASIASVTAQVAPGFDPVAATDAYLASVDAAARARSDAYFEGTYWLILWNALVGIVIAGALLQAGVVSRLSQKTDRWTRERKASRAPDGWARVALKLGAYRKLKPGPIEEIVFFDHPSGHTRILMAMQWKAHHPGEPDLQ